MSPENRMTSTPSPQGRRILIAVVTGEAGDRIQAWRLQHDPKEAVRLPPHATLCYWAPDVPVEQIGAQVRHGFPAAVTVRLGPVHQGDNDQGTMFVQILDQEELNAGLKHLYDGTHVQFPGRDDWRWHITCVRDTRGRQMEPLWLAAEKLQVEDTPWVMNTVVLMELRGDRYEVVETWTLEERHP